MPLDELGDVRTPALFNQLTMPLSLPKVIGPGEAQYNVLKEQIQQFEKSLDSEHEVAVMLASFGTNVTMSVVEITYRGNVLVFDGFVNGSRATLVQNMSQLNFLLLAAQRAVPESPKRAIGFSSSQD